MHKKSHMVQIFKIERFARDKHPYAKQGAGSAPNSAHVHPTVIKFNLRKSPEVSDSDEPS
jgi:hypothetical protein